MKKLILFILLLFVACSCSTTRYIPVEKNETVNIRDSVVLRDSVITTYINKERIIDVVPVYDTLRLETEYARSVSFVDTVSHSLKGELTQKDTVPVKTKILYKDRVVYKDRAVEKSVPVEVVKEKEVIPKWAWYSLGCNLLILLYLLLKFKRVL